MTSEIEVQDTEHVTRRKQLVISPTDWKELKALYDEYVMRCQQTYHIIPDFHDFMVQMVKNGFHVWQSKNCRTVTQ